MILNLQSKVIVHHIEHIPVSELERLKHMDYGDTIEIKCRV
jgi:hypothetical protein